MNKREYHLRHIACNMEDFHADRHRFRFEYNGKEYIAACYGALYVSFDDEAENEIPEDVLIKIEDYIWVKVDKEEKKWRYPKKAYEIANAYCEENFG